MIKAVYPGTFDPLTRGHEDLVRRAATLFDKLVLAIADSKAKRPFFTLDERIAMAREVLGDLKNVEVVGFSTKEYLTAKLERYRHAGITNVVLCVDLGSAPGCDFSTQICSFTRRVEVDDLLAMLRAGP